MTTMGSMLLPLVLALAAAAPQEARVVEDVVAVLRGPPGAPARIVTRTKLVEEARIALVARGAVEAAFRPLDVEALRAALGWLLDETLVADEAARLRVGEVDRGTLATEVRRFQRRFAGPAEYERFLAASELSEEELSAVLARSLRAQRYLESRVGGGARVGDDEVEAWIRARGAAPPASQAAREVVRAQLAEDRARAQAREVVADLRARADVRILDPELRPAAGEGR